MATRPQVGINLNSDPQAVQGFPANAADLNGVNWVRFVFFFHDAIRNGVNPFGYDLSRPLDYDNALNKAFAYHDSLIARYANVLLVLNQQSFAGNAPWFPGSDGNWDAFATQFAAFCGRVAAHYQGKNVAYEIWNEGDQKPQPRIPPASVYVPAELFAPILDRTVTEIRKNDTKSPIVLGGLVTGAERAIEYVKTIQKSLGGRLPVTDIGIHPYGAYPGQHEPAIPTRWFGTLDQEALKLFTQQLPDVKFWITEIGVSEEDPIPQEFWPDIADYMEGVYSLVETKYCSAVPVLIWFAWSDTMRNAGIVDGQGRRKQPIYDQFFKLANIPESWPTSTLVPQPEGTTSALYVTPIGSLNVREGPSADTGIKTQVSPGDRLEVLEDDRQSALAKLGRRGEWIHLRTADGIEGYSAAWYLVELATPVSIPTDPVAGRERALNFLHQPSFVDLPVMVSPSGVGWFNGFGPNNFSYDQFTKPDGGVYKRRLFGLHNGLDFGVPHGTPLRALDWGLVLHTSCQENDTPFGAKPLTVAILYGTYLSLCGHMSQIKVSAGDVVSPGTEIGLSGTDPNDDPHLHFETRELGATYLQQLEAQVLAGGPETIPQWFDPAQAKRNVRVFTNPARFFTVRLETYQWRTGFHMPAIDQDDNGYPDRIILAGDSQPTAFDMNWLSSYPPKQGNFWEGSHKA